MNEDGNITTMYIIFNSFSLIRISSFEMRQIKKEKKYIVDIVHPDYY